MTTSLTLQANPTASSWGTLAVGGSLILIGLVLSVLSVPWLFRSEPPVGAGHDGADESYAAELHAAADAEPDPNGWSAVNGFDYLTVFERIADGYGAAISPPPVLFEQLAAQLPQPDPSWLTFDTSAWRTVRASADELAREYPTTGLIYTSDETISEEEFDDFQKRWHDTGAMTLERV